jgi:hypothetical protein
MSALKRAGILALLSLLLASAVYALVLQRHLSVVTGVLLIGAVLFAALALSEVLTARPAARPLRLGLRAMFISIAVMLVAIEMVLRVMGIHATYLESSEGRGFLGSYRTLYEGQLPTWFHVYSPNIQFAHSKSEFSFPRTTNTLGLCEEEIPRQPDSLEYRVIALGDSYTEGLGVPYEKTWAKAIEGHARFRAVNARVYNAGISGSDPWYEYVLLREKLLDSEPNLVLVAVNASDIDDVLARGGQERFQPDGTTRFTRQPPPWEWLYGVSYLTRSVIHDLLRYDYLFVRESEAFEQRIQAVEVVFAALKAFDQLARARGFDLMVIVHPDRWEATRDRHSDPISVLLERLTSDGTITYVDVLSHWRDTGIFKRRPAESLYWELDGHNNADGYALLAEAVAQKAKDVDLPRDRRPGLVDAATVASDKPRAPRVHRDP